MKRAIGASLGALAGLAFSTMGLVDMEGELPIASGGGNEATPMVIAVGVAIGALLGLTVLWRFPIAILGAIIGLAAGMWLRDNSTMGTVQPPWVFLLLFGLPAVGAAGGYLLHLPRAVWARHPTEGAALVGLGAATLTYAVASFLWALAIHDPSCDPIPQTDGSVIFQLCADTGSPLWVGVVAAVLGIGTGAFTHARLSSTEAQGSDGTRRTS